MPKWKFVGGRLCLDFINSVGGRLQQKVKGLMVFSIREERLGGYEELVGWSREAGSLKEADAKRLILLGNQLPREAKSTFGRAMALRESLFRIFNHAIWGWEPPEPDIKALNHECALARGRQSLIYSDSKFTWELEADNEAIDCMIWPIALSAAELLSSEELSRVRQCPGADCGWLFLDTSKNHSRQWCDMKDCGNLAKVRRYRERQK